MDVPGTMADPTGLTLAMEVASGAGLAVVGSLLFLVRTRRAYTLVLGAFLLLWSGRVLTVAATQILLLLGDPVAARSWLWAHLLLGTVAYLPLAYVASTYPARRGPARWPGGLGLLAVPAVAALAGLLLAPAAFHPAIAAPASPDPRGAAWGMAALEALMWAAFYVMTLGLAAYHRRAPTAPERRRATYVLSALLLLVGFHGAAEVASVLPGLDASAPALRASWVRLIEGAAGVAVAVWAGGRALASRAGPPDERGLLAAATAGPLLGGAAVALAAPVLGFDATGLWRLMAGFAVAYAVIWFEAFDIEVKVVRGAVAGGVFAAATGGAFVLHRVLADALASEATATAVAQAVLFGALLVAVLSARSSEGLLHRLLAAVGTPHKLEARRLEVYEAALAQAVADGALGQRQGFLRDLRDRLGITQAEHQLLVQVVERVGGVGPREAVDDATGTAGALEPGQRLGDRYRLEEVLGEGGFGRALLALDEHAGRRVVVKALKMPREGRQEAVRAFLREARLAGAIDHPHVVGVLDLGVAGDTPYLVTEHVEGGTLRDRLDREGRLAPDDAVAICRDVLDGLAELHRRGIVHRDLKPANVLIDADGRARIGDFGVAVRPDPQETTTGLADVGAPAEPAAGTPATMSPEVMRGEQATAASDLYAVGAMLHECLAGRPYLDLEGLTAIEMRQAVLHKDPEPLPDDVDPALARVVRRALAKEPERRFASAEAMRRALERAAVPGEAA